MLQSIYAIDEVSDLLPIIPPDGFVFVANGVAARGDAPPLLYYYNSASTATPNGVTVIKPTNITLPAAGRYLAMALSYIDLISKPSFATVATSGSFTDLSSKPTISTAGTSGLYGDLLSKPSLATVATSGSYTDLSSKPSIPNAQQAYEGTTLRSNAFPIVKSATVASGVAVFNLTSDGTSGGTALFPNGVIQDSMNLYVNDASAAYQMAFVFSNSNKTITITANKLTTANILTGILGQASANGAVIKLTVWGY